MVWLGLRTPQGAGKSCCLFFFVFFCLSITLLRGIVDLYANDFDIKAFEYRNDFNIVGYVKVYSTTVHPHST